MIKWRPFHHLEDLFHDHHSRSAQWDLAVDVYEENDNVIAKMNIPGIDPDKINIDVEDNHLHVSGERKEEKEVNEKNYYHKEIRRGSFERIVPLPCAINKQKVSAEMHEGVLRIVMPKINAQEHAAKRIKINRK
jgi:HSP20 family protein